MSKWPRCALNICKFCGAILAAVVAFSIVYSFQTQDPKSTGSTPIPKTHESSKSASASSTPPEEKGSAGALSPRVEPPTAESPVAKPPSPPAIPPLRASIRYSTPGRSGSFAGLGAVRESVNGAEEVWTVSKPVKDFRPQGGDEFHLLGGTDRRKRTVKSDFLLVDGGYALVCSVP